jgi:hypothetical protein
MLKEKFDLQFFGDGDGQDAGDGGNGSNGQKPYAVFPDKESFHARVSREANKKLQEKIKALGFDSEEALVNTIKEYKAKQEEYDKALNAEKEARQGLELKLADLGQRVIDTNIQLTAAASGVKPEKMKHFLKLVDRTGLELKDDGTVDDEKIKAAVDNVLKDMPEFKGVPSAGGSDFKDGNKDTPDKGMDSIRKALGLK